MRVDIRGLDLNLTNALLEHVQRQLKQALVRAGVEMDRCTDCYGTWLDAGELNAIVIRSTGASHRKNGADANAFSPFTEPASDGNGCSPRNGTELSKAAVLHEPFRWL